MLVTETNNVDNVLGRILYIQYPIYFKKNEVQILLDLGSKANAITQAFASKLGFKICFTNVKSHKIDSSTLTSYNIVIAIFQANKKLARAQFFQQSFLIAKPSNDVNSTILFLALSNANVNFLAWELT